MAGKKKSPFVARKAKGGYNVYNRRGKKLFKSSAKSPKAARRQAHLRRSFGGGGRC